MYTILKSRFATTNEFSQRTKSDLKFISIAKLPINARSPIGAGGFEQ